MKRIAIERYELAQIEPTGYAGCIEGETDDGKRWIMWLDASGQPTVFWPEREASGAVVGEGILLSQAGVPGLEPRPADPESAMLPIAPHPISRGDRI
jgi:hypothetical protein